MTHGDGAGTSGRTSALHRAGYDADVGAVSALLAAGACVEARDASGYTPLLWACFRGAVGDQVPVVHALARAGADVEAVTAAGDANCLMLAAQSGNVGVVSALVGHGAAVDARVDGITALMVAARQGHAAIVEALLRFGADPAIRCGRYAASDYARHYGHDGLADLLAAASSRPTRDGVTP